MNNYCTYFDHRYLPRALALYRSLQIWAAPFRLWVLCLSEECERILVELNLPNVHCVSLKQLEAADPDLLAVKSNRSLVEYYFTCSPCLPRYLLQQHPGLLSITYLDADLWFFADPAPIFMELEAYSVGITPHRFTTRSLRTHGKYGRYNVGWVTFRRDMSGLACLEWWRKSCLAWCHDRLEGNRYADQKYLDSFESMFDGVRSIENPGANLAPWNVGECVIGKDREAVTVDGQPLVFYHFQGVRRLGKHLYNCNLSGYGARLDLSLRNFIYAPYLRALEEAEKDLACYLPVAGKPLARNDSRWMSPLRIHAGAMLAACVAAARGSLIRLRPSTH